MPALAICSEAPVPGPAKARRLRVPYGHVWNYLASFADFPRRNVVHLAPCGGSTGRPTGGRATSDGIGADSTAADRGHFARRPPLCVAVRRCAQRVERDA